MTFQGRHQLLVLEDGVQGSVVAGEEATALLARQQPEPAVLLAHGRQQFVQLHALRCRQTLGQLLALVSEKIGFIDFFFKNQPGNVFIVECLDQSSAKSGCFAERQQKWLSGVQPMLKWIHVGAGIGTGDLLESRGKHWPKRKLKIDSFASMLDRWNVVEAKSRFSAANANTTCARARVDFMARNWRSTNQSIIWLSTKVTASVAVPSEGIN
jgi:hypothetical protein